MTIDSFSFVVCIISLLIFILLYCYLPVYRETTLKELENERLALELELKKGEQNEKN